MATDYIPQSDAEAQTHHHVDETTPATRARPDGVTGCEIWGSVGEAPAGPSGVTYMGTDTGTPYMVVYDEEDAGKKPTTCCAGLTPEESQARGARRLAPLSQDKKREPGGF